jgi:hypothetical protein
VLTYTHHTLTERFLGIMSYWDFYWNFIPWVISVHHCWQSTVLYPMLFVSNIHQVCRVSLVGQDTVYGAPLFFVPFPEVFWYKYAFHLKVPAVKYIHVLNSFNNM